jgi:hypothetical protein
VTSRRRCPAVVVATHDPLTAFFTGLATALGAGVSMAFSEGLSDTSFARSFVSVTLGGAGIALLSSALGLAAA